MEQIVNFLKTSRLKNTAHRKNVKFFVGSNIFDKSEK